MAQPDRNRECGMSAVALAATNPGVRNHATHILLVGLPTIAMTTFAVGADVRASLATRRQTRGQPPTRTTQWRPATVLAAVLSVLAAAVHVQVAPAHYREDILFGVFF